MEPMFVRNYETDIEAAYLFNKKRLIKVLASYGITDWKGFLKSEYTSDDTEQVIAEFDANGWKYKKLFEREV